MILSQERFLIRTAFQISNEISTNVNWNYISSKALFCLQPEIGKKKVALVFRIPQLDLSIQLFSQQ